MHRDTLQFVHDKLVNAPVGVEAREKNRIAMARIRCFQVRYYYFNTLIDVRYFWGEPTPLSPLPKNTFFFFVLESNLLLSFFLVLSPKVHWYYLNRALQSIFRGFFQSVCNKKSTYIHRCLVSWSISDSTVSERPFPDGTENEFIVWLYWGFIHAKLSDFAIFEIEKLSADFSEKKIGVLSFGVLWLSRRHSLYALKRGAPRNLSL